MKTCFDIFKLLLVVSLSVHLILGAVLPTSHDNQLAPLPRRITGGGTDYRICQRRCLRKFGYREMDYCEKTVCRNIG